MANFNNPSTIALYKRLGRDPKPAKRPNPKFQSGTSTTKEFEKIVKTVFLPDPIGHVSAAAGLQIANANPGLRQFYEQLLQPLPLEDRPSDFAKSTDLLVRPNGVVTRQMREDYADRLRRFAAENSYKSSKQEKKDE